MKVDWNRRWFSDLFTSLNAKPWALRLGVSQTSQTCVQASTIYAPKEHIGWNGSNGRAYYSSLWSQSSFRGALTSRVSREGFYVRLVPPRSSAKIIDNHRKDSAVTLIGSEPGFSGFFVCSRFCTAEDIAILESANNWQSRNIVYVHYFMGHTTCM